MILDNTEKYQEGNRLEAKAAQGGLPKSLWETISAFANTAGGIIILGARERKDGSLEIVGLNNASKMLDDFWNAALSRDKLSARFLQDKDARIEAVNGKEVIVVEVPRASRTMRPVFLNKDILGETWRRTYTGDHRCTREEVQSMLRDAEATSDDSRIAEGAEMSYLDYDTVRKYRMRFSFANEGHLWNDATYSGSSMFGMKPSQSSISMSENGPHLWKSAFFSTMASKMPSVSFGCTFLPMKSPSTRK